MKLIAIEQQILLTRFKIQLLIDLTNRRKSCCLQINYTDLRDIIYLQISFYHPPNENDTKKSGSKAAIIFNHEIEKKKKKRKLSILARDQKDSRTKEIKRGDRREDEFWPVQIACSASFAEFHIAQHNIDATARVSNTCPRFASHPILL